VLQHRKPLAVECYVFLEFEFCHSHSLRSVYLLLVNVSRFCFDVLSGIIVIVCQKFTFSFDKHLLLLAVFFVVVMCSSFVVLKWICWLVSF
jgi:hypothetical protein